MFIENQWYAVLETNEVKTGKPVAYKRLGRELVFWRENNGKVVAMEDRCPHRQAKLSPGKVVNGNIECPFHGFQFDGQGDCQVVPANGKNGPRPKQFRPRVYPAREAHGFIWVWNGELRKDRQYPAIPFFQEVEGYSYGTLRKLWNTHYTRAIENQLDVAHLPFVHATTIGREGKTLVNGPYTEMLDDSLYVWYDNRHDEGQRAPKPGELARPDKPWLLCFKYPNIWLNRLSDKVMLVAAFVPVDEEHTMMYIRFYHKLSKYAPVNHLISKLAPVFNSPILRQDQTVVETQFPKQGGLETGDRYIPADRPILLYHRHRQELSRAAEATSEVHTAGQGGYSELTARN